MTVCAVYSERQNILLFIITTQRISPASIGGGVYSLVQ